MKKLNPILHQELRLSIISFLVNVEWVEFNKLLEVTSASKGNLSVQLKKLEAKDYIEIDKSFKNNYPLTKCRITDLGRSELETYVSKLKSMLNF